MIFLKTPVDSYPKNREITEQLVKTSVIEWPFWKKDPGSILIRSISHPEKLILTQFGAPTRGRTFFIDKNTKNLLVSKKHPHIGSFSAESVP